MTLLSSGYRTGVDGSGPLAVVRYGGHVRQSRELGELVQAVRTRRTNRRPFIDARVPASHRSALIRAAESERGWLYALSDREQHATVRDLVVCAHREQLADPHFLAELTAWTGRAGAHWDGVPVSAGDPQPEPQHEWVLRDFTAGRGRTRTAGKDFEPEPLLVVVCSYHEGALAELQAGQALQQVLLTAATLGLSASFLSQPIEVLYIRAKLRRALGTTLEPQAILRIGYGSPVPATPRRPVADLLIPRPRTPPSHGGTREAGAAQRRPHHLDQAAGRLQQPVPVFTLGSAHVGDVALGVAAVEPSRPSGAESASDAARSYAVTTPSRCSLSGTTTTGAVHRHTSPTVSRIVPRGRSSPCVTSWRNMSISASRPTQQPPCA